MPTGMASPKVPALATATAASSSSKRHILTWSTPTSRPSSPATAANTSAWEASRATSVATRRSAACSSASRSRAALASVLEIAVATSSEKAAIRDSVSAGSARPVFVDAIATPQRAPSTSIGAPTDDWIPRAASMAPMGPEASS